jgi:hypothetical protein
MLSLSDAGFGIRDLVFLILPCIFWATKANNSLNLSFRHCCNQSCWDKNQIKMRDPMEKHLLNWDAKQSDWLVVDWYHTSLCLDCLCVMITFSVFTHFIQQRWCWLLTNVMQNNHLRGRRAQNYVKMLVLTFFKYMYTHEYKIWIEL